MLRAMADTPERSGAAAEDGSAYVHGHHPSILRAYAERTAANSAAYLVDHLRPGTALLDVGCGAGSITCDLAEIVAPGRTVGVDAAPTALAEARDLAARRGVDVELVRADVTRLPFDDATFDVVHAHQVLQHVPDPVAVLREMRRVCRPGGLVAARDADYAAMTWFPEEPGIAAWRALYTRVARLGGGEPDAGRRLLSWARAAGFEDVTASASTWCHATPPERELWGGSWAERVVSSRIADRAVSAGLARPEDLAELAAGWRRWAAAPDGWFAVLHGEVLARA